jgi:hypothetical protein
MIFQDGHRIISGANGRIGVLNLGPDRLESGKHLSFLIRFSLYQETDMKKLKGEVNKSLV